MAFVPNFLIPLIKVTFLFGIIGFIAFYFGKAIHNAWSKEFKFTWKYKIRKQKYPEKTIIWCLEASDRGMGYYDVKKKLMVAGTKTSKMNETLWIFNEMFKINQKEVKQNGRKHKGSDRKIERPSTDLPSI